jgi:hypothetical protein
MKLLFNLEGMEGKCIRARRVGYPQSLPPAEQVATISEFLQRLQAAIPGIYNGRQPEEPHD